MPTRFGERFTALFSAIGANSRDFDTLRFGFEACRVGGVIDGLFDSSIIEFGCVSAMSANEKVALSVVTGLHTTDKRIEGCYSMDQALFE